MSHYIVFAYLLAGVFISGGYVIPEWDYCVGWKARVILIATGVFVALTGCFLWIFSLLRQFALTFYRYFHFKSWIAYALGRWDHMTDKQKADLPIMYKHYADKNPFGRWWMEAVARKNRIDLDKK